MGASIYTQILWWGFGAGEFGRWMDISPGNHLLWLIHKQQHPRGLMISRHWSHPKRPRRRWVHAKKILEIWNSGLFTKGGCFTQNQILRTFWHGPNALVDILDRTECPARGQARGDRSWGKDHWVLQSECCLPPRKKDLEAQGKDTNRCHSDAQLMKFHQKSTLLR